MTRLYRSAKDLQHWYVFQESEGWLRLPAKIDGWTERRPVHGLQSLALREVPRWLAFHTGLLETTRCNPLPRAA